MEHTNYLLLIVLQSNVQFVDYGNSELKFNNEIVEIPSSVQVIPQFASKYVLYGLKPLHDSGTMGYVQVSAHKPKTFSNIKQKETIFRNNCQIFRNSYFS